jgi:uncharacterized protein (DUF2062 family)
MEAEAYKVGFELKRLLLVAAYIPLARSHFLLAAGVHVPIWANPILPCRRTLLTIDPLATRVGLSASFTDSLWALHESKSKG